MISFPITRGPAFHVYAGTRLWPVLSNVAFLIVAAWAWRRTRGLGRLACAGTAAIGIGSGVYHFAPSDATLAFDWGPIALTLMWLLAAVVEDRFGARAGRRMAIAGSVAAVGSIVWWLATGGTDGGDMTAYVVVQGAGVVLPAAIALAFKGGHIRAIELLAAVAMFGVARLCAAHDSGLLDAIGISGHSLKHVAAAIAAAIALQAVRRSNR
jgi:hypothetical protein